MNENVRPSHRPQRGGFTLVELLIALSILLIFGVMAATALTYGTQLWRSANRRSYAFDVATFVFQQLEDDLSAVRSQFWGQDEDAYDTRVKFWVDHDGEFDGDWETDGGRQRLRFVRGIPDATVNPRLRQAGDRQDNDEDGSTDEEYYNLKDDDDDDEVDEDLMPLEGMCEVAYVTGLGDDGSGAVTGPGTLYRVVLAPIGHVPAAGDTDSEDDSGANHYQMTFFHGLDEDEDNDPDDDDADSVGTSYRIDKKSVRLADGILHFEVRLWTQYTTTWDLWDEDGERLEFAPWQSSHEPEVCPPVFTWDSDRLADDGPDFLMDPGRSGFPNDTDDHDNDRTVNEDDEDYVRDNVFPRSVMVVLVVDPSVEYPSPRRLEVRNDVDDADTEIQVNGELPAYNTAWPYIRINDEWIRFESFEPDEQGGTFIVDERPVRGTTGAAHNPGDEVRFGMTFTRVFHNPAAREYWGQ
ncbi:MAG: prepilin-type N-terminal cleavage/methylation domain-containing protein [Candidatus Brocadiia bacterium]